MNDLLAECAAHPDDDAPRLVWADRVGGERGELVVIQCDLARGGLSLDDERDRRQRERVLLSTHGATWAGELAMHATRWQFRRGFIDAVQLRGDQFGHLDLTDDPLVSTITLTGELDDVDFDRLLGLPHLRGLGLDAGAFARLPQEVSWRFSRLRAIGMRQVQSHPALRYLLSRAPIEQLWIPEHELDVRSLDNLLGGAPGLRALDASGATTPLAPLLMQYPLRALHASFGAEALLEFATRAPGTLEHLAIGVDPSAAIAAPGLAALRSIHVHGDADPLLVALANDPTALPNLRVIRAASWLAEVPRDLVIGRLGVPELMYGDVAAMGQTGTACFERQTAFWLGVGTTRAYEFVDRPVDEPISIGPGGCTIDLWPSPPFAQQGAEIRWRDGRHVLRNQGPRMDGVRVDGELVTERVLPPEAAIEIGDVDVHYQVGRAPQKSHPIRH
ncbi:MAG: hypothetical protein NT062_33670 [Proteobacteria bacterium]|nr:hypothetical protein [Pseudomonadota bacterium]